MQKFVDSNKPLKIAAVLCCLCLVFIWGHSMMPSEVSTAESDAVKALVMPEVEPTADNIGGQNFFVRKSAHIIEYLGCGALVTIMVYLCFARFVFKKVGDYARWWGAVLLSSAAICLLIALIDEGIQLLQGREGKMYDVILDCQSSGLAIVIVVVILGICSAISVSRSKRK